MTAHESIRERLPALRRAVGMSARGLAAAAGAGLTREVIANVESGRTSGVSIDQLIAISSSLRVHITDLVPELIPVLPNAAEFESLRERLDSIRVIANG